jgi:ABC-type transport system substrate-binding protein
MNTRRVQFKDARVREALIDAFDFEWTNRTLMYGAYKRTESVFQNSPLMAEGKPTPDELALLEPFRGRVPDEVFGEPFVPPVTDGSGQDRKWLRKAAHLLNEAGYKVKGGKRMRADGQPFTIEFLMEDAGLMPHHQTYIKNLNLLGINATPRLVDPVQYRGRVDDFDFDMALQLLVDAGRFTAHLFLVAGGEDQGHAEHRRHFRSGDRCADRHHHRSKNPRGTHHRVPRTRPGDPRRALLGAALVSRRPPHRLLGRVRPSAAAAEILPRHPADVVV